MRLRAASLTTGQNVPLSVAELSIKIVLQRAQGLHVLFFRAALPLSHQTLTFVSRLVRTHRREIGSPWRVLNPGQQALLVLVYLRKGEPFAEVGAGVRGIDHDVLAVCMSTKPLSCWPGGHPSSGRRCGRPNARATPMW